MLYHDAGERRSGATPPPRSAKGRTSHSEHGSSPVVMVQLPDLVRPLRPLLMQMVSSASSVHSSGSSRTCWHSSHTMSPIVLGKVGEERK